VVITGDVLHHPIQCRHSEWTARGDADPDAARATRRALLAAAATTNALMLGTHFTGTAAGRILSTDQGYPLRAATPRLTFRHLQACARHRILGRTSGGNDP